MSLNLCFLFRATSFPFRIEHQPQCAHNSPRLLRDLTEADPMKRYRGLGLLGVLFTVAFVPAVLLLHLSRIGGTEKLSASEQERRADSKEGSRFARITLKNLGGQEILLPDFLAYRATGMGFIASDCLVKDASLRVVVA